MKGDTTVETNEKYLVELGSATYETVANSQASGYIRNNDTAAALPPPNEPSD